MKTRAGKRLVLLLVFMLAFTSLGTGAVFAEPTAVSDLKAEPGYEAVLLSWKANGAEKYYVYKKDPGATTYSKAGETTATEFRAKGIKPYKNYSFYVTALKDGQESSKSNVVTGACIREMTYTLKIKKGGKLKSHGGPKVSYKLKKGQTLIATGFSAGKYMFKNNKSVYYCAKTRTSSRKANYTKKFNYSEKSAEDLANNKKLTSRTNKMLWVSTYTQRVYYFEKQKNGKWECTDQWECATGKASAPTPTGVTGQKAIWKKVRSRHGIPWWSPFSSMNSMHGRKKGWGVGKPASSGCVRNPNDKAKKVYKTCKVGTRVLIF